MFYDRIPDSFPILRGSGLTLRELSEATRAGHLALEYGFSELLLEQVSAVVLPENSRVISVLQRLGFGTGQEPNTVRRAIGERTDTLVYQLQRGSWDARSNEPW